MPGNSTRSGPGLGHLNTALARAGSEVRFTAFFEGRRPILMVSNGARGSVALDVATELETVLTESQIRRQAAPHSDQNIDGGAHGRVTLSPKDQEAFLPAARLAMFELLNSSSS